MSVLVFEAGPHIIDNINVTVPAFATRLWTGGPDWVSVKLRGLSLKWLVVWRAAEPHLGRPSQGFLTTPQVNVNNRSLPTLRGKAVGGTTIMNGMVSLGSGSCTLLWLMKWGLFAALEPGPRD